MSAVPTLSTASMARGACPALDAPMLTGDGYLSRIALVDAISPRELAALCALSERHGNGMIDISARGNLQIRGLTPTSAAALEADVRRLALPLREGLAVEWSPLAGLDPTTDIDPRPLGLAIMARAKDLRGSLAPKLSVVIESCGLIRLDDLLADIRLVATENDVRKGWHILLGGTARQGRVIGFVHEDQAADCVAALLSHLAALGPRTRGRDVDPAGLPEMVSHALEASTPQLLSPHRDAFGLLDLKDGKCALRVALPFGQIQSRQLSAFADHARRCGIESVRPAAEHTLLAFGSRQACTALQAAAKTHGFITDVNDPLRQIDACPGAPSCQSARLDTHALGRLAAEEAGELFDGSLGLHLSGCLKACAHPTAATLVFAGTDDATHLVIDGKTTDTPAKRLFPQTEAAALSALSALMRQERQPGETSRDCLRRLGPERIAAALA
ncbi:precorrin-3B synthase [Rhizobium sp. CSW-27]|uniref:precorrin-3B synthase n=1 Tax=Rhizobium sp. CSW-27 TaxID=2839985 RepID=UPI001C010A87|nr:precorrin-3B synthase [Rhizobium sp. CSW-27]MBT9370557.1 precorrin-3B synthase [Rhizobium sp. CSW-27]